MVYVDELRRVRYGRGGNRLWCHMVADTLDELHAMARKIGMNRRWFQNRSAYPHYDLTPSRRGRAILSGAKETTSREIVIRQMSTRDSTRRGEVKQRRVLTTIDCP